MCNFALPNNGENGQAMDRRPVSLSCCEEGPSCEAEGIPGKQKTMKQKFFAASAAPLYINKMEQGWKSNIDLGCDVKTILRSDRRMKVAKEYQGIFRLDAEAVVDEFLCRDAHYTFVEAALATSPQRRNVHLYEGRHITCTIRPDGLLRLNFKQLKPETLGNVGSYALEVANEIQEALRGLVEEGMI